MLFADQMVNSYYASFQLAPKALDTIRMITAFDIFASMVVYYFMLVIFMQAFVAIPTVSNYCTAFRYKRIDCMLQYPFAGFWNDLCFST